MSKIRNLFSAAVHSVTVVNPGLITTFWAVSLLLVCTPGADWAYAITAGLRYPSVRPAVTGLLAGHALAMLTVAAGTTALLAGVPIALAVLTDLGAAYLIRLGIATLWNPPALRASEGDAVVSSWRQTAQGFGVSGLNPKVSLLFLTLLPQFTDAAAAWPIAVQVLALGAVHLTSCLVVYTGVGLSARAVLGAHPAAARLITRFSGVAMISVGLFLLAEHVPATAGWILKTADMA